MKDEHFSFRGGTARQDRYFLSSLAMERIVEFAHEPFDPYESYSLSYQIYFISGISANIPDPEKSDLFFGTLQFVKKVEGHISSYFVERCIRTKPASVTKYQHAARNDLWSTISPESIMTYQYQVHRKDDAQDLASIHHYEQHRVWPSEGRLPLFTNFSLMDTLQKLTISRHFSSTSLDFEYLENMEFIKTPHHLQYVETIQVRMGGRLVRLIGYCQTGIGILPAFYWITERGLLIAVRYGISFLVLEGGSQDGK